MSNRSLALRRINKDIKEITKNPIEGIGIAPLEENIMWYVINMRLMSGPYEGYCVQLLLMFSDNYPTKPPKILIFPNQAISNQYHHHIFDDISSADSNGHHFKKFCFDLLDNDFMKTSDEKTGWNPSYSISSLLLQVQNFISDPDMGDHIPDDYLIQQLMKSMDTYTKTFNITNEKGIKEERIHTWKNPYPEMYFKPKEKGKNNENTNIKDNEKIKSEENKIQQIKENLTCFMLKVNYIDDPNIILGYPIMRTNIFLGRKMRLELYPIPELLTYDGFLAQTFLQMHMVENIFGTIRLKSANNEYYNSWLPAYINKEHYEKNKETILNTIAGIIGAEKFIPDQIFFVMPVILNSMIIGMYKEKSTLSSSFIRCYFQYILLFKKLCQEYEVDYSIMLNSLFDEIKNNNYSINKNIIPDIGNLFIVLLFNKVEASNDSLKKIYNAVFEDSITRQMSWMFHSYEAKDIKKFLLYNKSNETYLENFEKDPNFKMNNLSKFNEDLHTKNIYNEIIDTISEDKGYLEHILIGKEKAKQQAEKRIKQSFKRLFQECSQEGRNKLKDIILKNLNFKDYFGYIKTYDESLYDSFKVDEILKQMKDEKIKNEFIQLAFESQLGNKLLLITFFAQKKIEEKNFLEELEKNYGVYLDVDNFIKNMKEKLSEIKTYKSLFEYVGCDFFKEGGRYKDDLELIIDSYKKGIEKGYFGRPKNNFLGNSSNSLQNNLSASNYSLNRSNNNNNNFNLRNSRNLNEYRQYNRNDNRNTYHNNRRNRSRSRSHSHERRHHHRHHYY